MKHVYTSSDIAEATMIKGVLEKEGIRSVIKNEVLSGGLGFSLGNTNTWPEVWVVEDADLEKAEEIIKSWSKS